MYATDDDVSHPAIQEWLNSGVDPGIIELNVQIVSGRSATELLLGNQIERLQKNTNYVTARVACLLERHTNLESGGWWVTGVDPLNDYARMEWGQLKPNTPRRNEKGQPIKYEGLLGEPTRAVFLDVPPHIAERVYVQAGINPSPEHRAFGFWHCVKEYGIGIVLTEGAKKAGAVLTAGFPAIALPGIWNGRRVDRAGKIIYSEGLIPDLELMADGRKVTFCFDRDEKEKTRRAVAKAIRATSALFRVARCECVVARWSPDWGKGIDDVAHAHGHARVVEFITTASPLDHQATLAQLYKAENAATGFTVIPGGLTGEPKEPSEVEQRDRLIRKRDTQFRNLRQHLEKDFKLTSTRDGALVRYTGYAPSFTLNQRTVLLRGWLGSGKTEATLRSLLEYQDRQIIWLSNRNGLLRQTIARARRMGFPKVYHYQDDPASHREGLRDGYPGIYTMCPDSLKDYATKHVNWSEAILVIDEFASIRKDILKNTSVMPEFERLLTEAKHAIAVDAFLGLVDVKVLSQYRGNDRQILDQEFTESLKRVYWLETRTTNGAIALSHDGIAYPLIKQWVEAGYRFVITTDSKLLGKALHDYIESLGVKGVLCTSETITTNKALLSNPDARLQGCQTLTYTPAAQNGLDVQTPFDKGLALYHGVVSPLDFMQMMGRPRQCAEWYVSAPRRSLDASGTISSLSPAKFEQWHERVSQTLADLGAIHAPRTDGWSLWQAATGQIHAAFASEYLRWLLGEFFTSVELIEVETNRDQWQDDIRRIKDEEAALTLEANLQNGQNLLRKQKSPSTDAEVWDVALAEAFAKRPKVWKWLVERYQDAEEKEEAIDLARLFLSPRIERLKQWVSATGEKSEADLDRVFAHLRRRFTSYLSPQFREAQCRLMFLVLRLGDLAQFGRKQEGARGCKDSPIAHETHFRYDSPTIERLWQLFRRNCKLQRICVLVDDLATFWGAIKRCMSYFGYQSDGTSIRVNTPGERHKNGRDHTGKQRFSESASLHFLGWIVMEKSGSELFQENFGLIVEALKEELEFDRRIWEQNLERQQGPPVAA